MTARLNLRETKTKERAQPGYARWTMLVSAGNNWD
jgi:hypothetical protein